MDEMQSNLGSGRVDAHHAEPERKNNLNPAMSPTFLFTQSNV